MDGFFNILKPTGLTSSDVVGKVRKIIGQRDVGHMGTLDPFGSGVLPVAIGLCTRLFDFLQQKTKKYRASFCFGFESDTLDSAGTLKKTGGKIPSEQEINAVIPALSGFVDQLPPSYSAKKIGGLKAYDLARKNIKFELQPRRVCISKIELVQKFNENTYIFDIECSGGTYIRSICRDMAANLNTSAVMSSIIRLESGDFKLSDSYTLEELADNPQECLITIDEILKNACKYTVPDIYFDKLKNGIPFTAEDLPEGDFVVVCNKIIFGIGYKDEGRLILRNRLFRS